ncbi:zinc finger protein 2-like [Sinocyclocheilus rhinocerous]|uniref:Zinc finger protein 2-like n=1 Tax=Sinocyclocheilus rhinocerous TaxID=307959 RepID=A0A673NP91_9TELE|nr:PREDICTED: zinc finger protein 2-like [Sinocyclocheilus rhinocerous]
MLHKCVVGGCPNRSDIIIHYMLPEDPKRRSLWLKFIEDSKDDGENATSSCRVCGNHFSEENYFKMDLGYATCMILSVDAVPTLHTVDRSSETEREIQEAEDEYMEDDTGKIAISEAVSLACVKEEPLEYELSTNMTSGQEQNSSLDESVKYEESELSVTEDGTSTVIFRVKENHARKFINCLTCGQRFRSRRTLMKHRRANHSKKKTKSEVKEKFYICSTCGERFNKMGLLLRHRAIHTKENPEGRFMCQQCGKGFPDQAFLKAHQKVHEDAESIMPFTCHLCPRRFGYKVALIAHMKHHSSKLASICPICEKSHQFRGSLIQHLKSSHAGEKLLCKTCDKSFLRVNGYVKHMDRHNVMTPFYCDICKIYLSLRGYMAHMLTHEQKSLPEQQPDESVENQPNDTEISLAGVNSTEEGIDSVTVRQEEAGMEPLSEDEMEVLSGSSVDPLRVEDVESENVVVGKELCQDNHEEKEKSKDSSGT